MNLTDYLLAVTWLSDKNGNKCSVDFFGSEEEAQKALDSLKECRGCINCSDCSGGAYCTECSRCSYCAYCAYCLGCSFCSYCLVCSYSSNCSRCSYCTGCSWCSGCWECSYKKNLQAIPNAPTVPTAPTQPGPPPIPVIPDIHKAIYAAASRPNSLEMSSVRPRKGMHCRGGWTIALAGEAGLALEKFYNWELAAMLIYDASAPGLRINPARFDDGDKDALADMKQLAEGETP